MADDNGTNDEGNKFAQNLGTLFGLNRASTGQSMSFAAVDNFIRQSKDMLHANKWHRSQVDALLKRNYAECGHEGIYEPPADPAEDDEEDGMGGNNTFMNNTIISDRAAALLVTALDDSGNTTNPTQPPPVNPPAGVKPPWWRILLGTLLSVLIGSLIVFLAWKAFGGQPRYELIAEPFEIPKQIEFTR